MILLFFCMYVEHWLCVCVGSIKEKMEIYLRSDVSNVPFPLREMKKASRYIRVFTAREIYKIENHKRENTMV